MVGITPTRSGPLNSSACWRATSARSRTDCKMRAGAPRHFDPGRRQQGAAARPLDQRCAERRLQLLDLHAERRLGDVAAQRRLAEMLRFGQRDEIAELAQRRLHR